MINLTITASQIARSLPMTVICLDKSTMFKNEKITFFKCVSRWNEWFLCGRLPDRSAYFSTDDPNEKFGVIEDEINN